MNQQLSNYLAWQQERGFLWPLLRPQLVSTNDSEVAALAVLCRADDTQRELLFRMLSSIGIDATLVGDAFGQRARLRLLLQPPPPGYRLGEAIPTSDGLDFYSYHPADLLAVPELKPIAWHQLKTFAGLIDRDRKE